MITPRQIREKKISTVERDGYDRNEVNELLVDIIESYEAVCEENKELYRKMEILANRIEEYRDDEDSIKTAIISAQKMAHQVTAEAKEKAEQTIAESAASAQQTVQDAKAKADKIVGEAREYVSNLTKEKAQAADEIIADAQSKANAAISSAQLVAQDTLDKAKKLTAELVEKAKSEKGQQQEMMSRLKAESREFKTNLVNLYEAQLNKLKELAQSGAEDSIEGLESELDEIVDNIGKAAAGELEMPEPEEAASENNTAEEDEAETSIDEAVEDTAEEIEETADEEVQEEPAEEFVLETKDEVDDIINEIETMEPAFEPVEDEKQPTEEDVENALNAFTADEITPVDDAVASIPVIEDEPEFESSQPFETFFNVDKASVNTDETISLVAPDEDDEDDRGKFKGFFKKKK
ncbi:MAG: hypothetical protein HFJ97_01245 [Eubacterium sp.]|nr:hypothetical protein [Eubacterium sp.]